MQNEAIAAYLERVKLYFSANAIAENKLVPVFLGVIGAKTYTLLRNLLAPTKLSEASLGRLTEGRLSRTTSNQRES